jgi:DNA-directed RNA polymerase subunit RPC12/RpoP
MILSKKYICTACGHEWELPPALRQQDSCPSCSREQVRRVDAGIRRQEFELAGQRETLDRIYT